VRKNRYVDWTRYWRSGEQPLETDRSLEAMHAHFERHVYHRHSHQTYSFGVTDWGAQAFHCRGSARVSAAGMVMAFNPEDPHDGQATDEWGFTYRIVHLGTGLVAGALADAARRPVGLPLFAEPVVADVELAGALRALHRALLPDPGRPAAGALRRDELLDRVVRLLVCRGATRPVPVAGDTAADARRLARVAREYLADAALRDVGGAELAAATGRSRYAVYRAFRAEYGMAPSDYQRQVRLRAARRLLAAGRPAADAAVLAGFADQAHLTRWFRRYFGITPAAFARS
jgi:AraC-like DNA-binding protein